MTRAWMAWVTRLRLAHIAVALALLCIAGLLVLRRAGKVFIACRFCAARIPRLAMRCAICGSSLEPAE